MKKTTAKLEEMPELPPKFAVVITGPPLTDKKRLVSALETKGFLKIPTFTTKPATYEPEDFYVRVDEDEWDARLKGQEFICKTKINGYNYALEWGAFAALEKHKRPVVLCLDRQAIEEFGNRSVEALDGLCVVNILCRNQKVLNVRLARYARLYSKLSSEHIDTLAHVLHDEHLVYEEVNAHHKFLEVHENNAEDTAEYIRNKVVDAYLSETPILWTDLKSKKSNKLAG